MSVVHHVPLNIYEGGRDIRGIWYLEDGRDIYSLLCSEGGMDIQNFLSIDEMDNFTACNDAGARKSTNWVKWVCVQCTLLYCVQCTQYNNGV